MGVVGDRVDLEERRERLPRPVVLPRVVEGPAESLENRGLARLDPRRALEHDGGRRVVALLEQVVAALQQLVGRLALVDRIVHAQMVARIASIARSTLVPGQISAHRLLGAVERPGEPIPGRD